MRFSSAISVRTDLEEACREAAARAAEQLGPGAVDLCVVFVHSSYGDKERVPILLDEELAPGCLVGCSGAGIIGAGSEVEGRPAISVTLARLPGVDLNCLQLHDGDLPSEDAGPSAWIELLGQSPAATAGFIVLPEPFTFGVHDLLVGLDFAYPDAPVAGGIASGSQHPGGHALFTGRSTQHSGCVVLGVSGDVVMETRVAQGCKPFGKVGRITEARDNYLIAIDNQPALRFLQEQLRDLEGSDLELARHTPMFLGIAMDPFASEAPAPGDFLIRNVMDCDTTSGSLTIGEMLSVGRAVQFHLRDRDTSSDDLRNVLVRGESERTGAGAARGALLFSCLGRGVHLYGEEGHDSRVFGDVVGDVPLGGFFCNGEIGPVQGTTHIHGYTSSFAMFSDISR